MKLKKLCFLVICFCFFAKVAYPQSSPNEKDTPRNYRKNTISNIRQRANEISHREKELQAIEENRDNSSIEDIKLLQKQQIAHNFRELKEKNEKLFLATRNFNEKDLKEIINTANKLGKISKDLRKNLDLKPKKDLEKPIVSVHNPIEQIRSLATRVNELVSEVSKAQNVSSVDASQFEKTEKNFQEIENNLNLIKELANKK